MPAELFTWLGVPPTSVGGASVLVAFTLAWKRKKPQASSPDYRLCPACGFEQWLGYAACQKCGSTIPGS